MTTPRRPPGPTPEQVAAGGPPPNIELRSQRLVPTQPVPGQVQDLIAITYRIAPNPPQVIFHPAESLPAWVFRQKNPGKEPPPELERQNDEVIKRLIQERQRQPAAKPRMI